MAAEAADVIVVGAGLSGLTAAREIQRAGYSCIVLEAEDRVGGMLLSVDQKSNSTNSNVAVDVGAAWLNDTTQSAIWGLVQRFGLTTETQDSEGELLREMEDGSIITGTEGNKKLTPDELKAMASFYAHLGALAATIDPSAPHTHPQAASLDSITLAQFCTQHTPSTPLVPLLLNASVRYLVGAEATDVSALWFLAHCAAGTGLQNMMSARSGGGQHLRVREGTQRVADGLAGELAPGTVRLSSPVAAVEQSPSPSSSSSACTVTTTAGQTFLARAAAVLAVPSTLHNGIAFAPPLPPAKKRLADAAAAARTGFFAKATLVYDRPWWRDNEGTPAGPLSGIFESVLGPVVYSRNTNVPDAGHWSITGFVVGEPGRRWGRLGTEEERKRAVVEQLGRGFGAVLAEGRSVPEPVAYVEGVWEGRKYGGGGGSVPVLGTGVVTAVGGAAAEPFGRVHFVGSETAGAWRGYMEGAVRSGMRGAEEVVRALGKGEGLQAGKL